MVQRRLAAGIRLVGKRRGLAAQVGNDAPAGAGLAVAGDRIGIAERDDDLSLAQRGGVAHADRDQVGRGHVGPVDAQDGQVAPRVGRLDPGAIDAAVGGGDVVAVVLVAQHVAGGEDQPATIDHHAGAVLVGNEIRIGGQRRAADRQLASERIGTKLQADGVAALFLADPGDRHDRLLGRRDRLHQRVLEGGRGVEAGRLLGGQRRGGQRQGQSRGKRERPSIHFFVSTRFFRHFSLPVVAKNRRRDCRISLLPDAAGPWPEGAAMRCSSQPSASSPVAANASCSS